MKKIFLCIITIISYLVLHLNVSATESVINSIDTNNVNYNELENKDDDYNISNNIVKHGWIFEDGYWYYYINGNTLKGSWQGNYYLGDDGKMLTETMTPDGYYVDKSGMYLKGSWYKNKVGWWFGFSNGYYVKDSWQTINGVDYYFNTSGYILTSTWKDDYYLTSSGAKLKDSMTPDGYYVDKNGKYVIGSLDKTEKGIYFRYTQKYFAKNKWVLVNGDYYYFGEDGLAVKSRWIGNYYLGEDAIMYVNKITPDNYYTDETGLAHSEILIEDSVGKKIFTKSQGFIESGWKKYKEFWYYLINGYVAANKWIDSNYYVGHDGKMLVSSFTPDGYYVDASGKWLHNSWDSSTGNWRYFDSSGRLVTGKWLTIEGKQYYFYENGNMASNTLIDGKYYVDFSGAYVEKTQDVKFFQYLSMLSKTGFSAEELNNMIKASRPNSILATQGHAFKKAESEYGINALYLMCIAIIESNWGESTLAKTKYNFFGWQAYDVDPYGNAKLFKTAEDGILYVAERMTKDYLLSDGIYYSGSYLGDESSGMNKFYASDPDWGYTIALQVRYFTKAYKKG